LTVSFDSSVFGTNFNGTHQENQGGMSEAMTRNQPFTDLVIVSAWILLWLTGCLQQPVQPAPVECPPCPTARLTDLTSRNRQLEAELAARTMEENALNRRIADLEIALLQSTAQVNDLERRVGSQQEQLDDTITEVVRTKSKLRSIESKAEAASTIAEAEIAVRSIQNRNESEDREASEALEKAQRLLEQSTVEFKAGNYGGALYLAVQSKSQANTGESRPQSKKLRAAQDGETAFDQILPLTLTKNTNLRAGPDLNQRVLATLKRGTAVVGYGFKENWIRVETDAGMIGWVHQSLVMAR